MRPDILSALSILGSALVLSVAACGHIKIVPDNAAAFQDGLRCGMSQKEVRAWAAANDMDGLACTPLSDNSRMARCDTGSGRAVEALFFGNDRGLISVQPGYVYDLTYLTYDPVIELCARQ
ncbi:MAG: hypothetical protein ACKVOI_15440 [Dongiaceae bacterium]